MFSSFLWLFGWQYLLRWASLECETSAQNNWWLPPLHKVHFVHRSCSFSNPFFLLLVLNNVSDTIPFFFLSTVSKQVLGIICRTVNTLHGKKDEFLKSQEECLQRHLPNMVFMWVWERSFRKFQMKSLEHKLKSLPNLSLLQPLDTFPFYF